MSAGETLCLNNGTHSVSDGQITDESFASQVIVRSTNAGGASINGFSIWDSDHITFEDVTMIGSIAIYECSQYIYLTDVTFTQQEEGVLVRNTGEDCGVNGYHVFDGCTFDAIENTGYEGRISLSTGAQHITIKNCTFQNNPTVAANQSDGIFLGGDASDITIGPGNYFYNLHSTGDVHVDSIQMYGTNNNVTITQNYFYYNDVHIGFYDGGITNLVLSHNVFDTAHPGSSQLHHMGGIQGATLEHNTYHSNTMGIGTKTGDTPNSNWTVKNNIFDDTGFSSGGDQDEGVGSGSSVTYNLLSDGGTIHQNDGNNVTGDAVWIGTGSYQNWQNWQLDSGSPGENAGDDSNDMGTTFYGPEYEYGSKSISAGGANTVAVGSSSIGVQ